MRVVEVITIEDLKVMLDLLRHMNLSFTEQAIIEKFVQRFKPRKAIMVDDFKRIIEKEIDISTGEDDD